MNDDDDDQEDPNEDAARVVRDATTSGDTLPADIEAAWEAWAQSIQDVDERTVALMRAAFEVGAEAAAKTSAAELGRRGGKKGGRARAEKLTPEQRSEIARNAAAKRWGSRRDE